MTFILFLSTLHLTCLVIKLKILLNSDSTERDGVSAKLVFKYDITMKRSNIRNLSIT